VEASNGDGEDSLTDRKTCRSINFLKKIKKKKKKNLPLLQLFPKIIAASIPKQPHLAGQDC
jgi:hypothetical protein